MTSKANAGVGRPLNSYFWSVILKIASLIADINTIINDTNGKISEFVVFFIKWNIIKVGASPKLIKSDNESICLPNSELTLSIRAANPSKKSKTAARIMNNEAIYNLSDDWNEKYTDIEPLNKFNDVMAFGITIFFNLFVFLNSFFTKKKNKK